jgi:hypothetical protein
MELQLLVDKDCQLEKFPGKGGWTFLLFPELLVEKKIPFGMRKVSGQIDSYEFAEMTLMPFGKGVLFLPVKSEIRKKIGKGEGDWVRVRLFTEAIEEADDELMTCLKDAPLALERFLQLPEEEREMHIQSINDLKIQDRKVEKIVRLIEQLERNF